jgi:hypothetical protein
VSEARLGKVWDECLSATKTTELGTFPDYTNRRETLELVLRARGLLKGEDRLAEGALLATRLLLPLIARYVRPEDKAAFDADVAEVLQSNG